MPPASIEDAEALARDRFGLAASAKALTGERDRNFHLLAEDGAEYVLKIAHPAEDVGVLDLQDRALEHIALRDPSLPVPRVRRAGTGETVTWETPGLTPRVVRVLTYLDGSPWRSSPHEAAQRRGIGEFLARLDLALADFRHPHETHDLLWDLQHAARVRDLLMHADPARRALPLRFLDRFERHALPALPRLRSQLIHNDFNPHNILVDIDGGPEVVGIIDFGDMVRAPLIQDLATAIAYHVGEGPDPLRGPAQIVAAYHAHCPLTPDEIAILPDLLAARLSLNIAVSSWRAARHPDNAPYILRNQARAWSGLTSLDAMSRDEARNILAEACK